MENRQTDRQTNKPTDRLHINTTGPTLNHKGGKQNKQDNLFKMILKYLHFANG